MRLIDADALKKIIPTVEADIFENCSRCKLLDDIEVKRIIDEQPTIEAEPIKHAMPIVYYHGENTFSYECGVCRMPIDGKDYYCRWCGAKMDEVEE